MLITKEMLKQFARYEITGEMFYEDEYEIEDNYQITLEDFKLLLKRLEVMGNESFEKFEDEWFEYVYYYDDVSEALGLEDYTEGNWAAKEGLIKTDENLISYIMHEFETASDEYWDVEDSSIAKMLDFDKINKVISDYEDNKSKPLAEWEYPDDIKADVVSYVYRQEKHPEKISADELILFKRYVEELIAKDNLTALRAKGYLTYGGSPFYECDWYSSRDCITRCFELTKDAGYANTLGYIYYYGRCNNGEPEYEKAFRYFTYGHANNWYESSYKLADMYRKGRGTIESKDTANSIIEDLYGHAYKDFCNGHSHKLADVALRMGGIREDEGNMSAAHYYYLVAKYVIDDRLKYNHYGDSVVLKGIIEGLERTEKEMTIEDRRTVSNDYRALFAVLDDDYICEATVKELTKDYKISIKRIAKRSQQVPDRIMIVLNECNYCDMTDKIDIYVSKENCKNTLPLKFRFSDVNIEWNDEANDREVQFILFDEKVAAFNTEFKYKLRAKQESRT